ncbi:putative Vacuolar membrane protein [Monocercomonoides exilis]|uniref:putative Vacuolar membrane protein n=1 Tax=Monocercomonoides exilis TaxID=2049356 RepID=UPI003559E2F3|nr:putative Vacuolar membrane protein [Monocercomonoides exilis]|eukprot:MONOS_7682.1-p1 / transcript=MONOS_7682.1 / gene=MONOS_7682 / organism=Monocercomonoides_exilis_PA203 / gene_product=Vacuolar membrane protein YPL162C / transcript_product=Vacuolar membrane protein YPL162C / location=Mono_scaffold00269:2615-4277(+) / protein_length=419 / sequence_SO=supercontig / SO=protein_coding / is_pseudo=false
MVAHCDLGGWFSWSMQGIMGVVVYLSLIVKWMRERPQRPAIIWFFDTTKQVAGVLLQHFSNLFFAMVIGKEFSNDECAWYSCSHLVDSIVGVFFCWLMHKGFLWFVNKHRIRLYRLRSGIYGDPPSFSTFLLQMLIWLVIVALSKCIVFPLLYIFGKPLFEIFRYILSPIEGYPELELATVLFIIPLIVNTCVFWISDSFLKMKTRKSTRFQKGRSRMVSVSEYYEEEYFSSEEQDPANMPYALRHPSTDEQRESVNVAAPSSPTSKSQTSTPNIVSSSSSSSSYASSSSSSSDAYLRDEQRMLLAKQRKAAEEEKEALLLCPPVDSMKVAAEKVPLSAHSLRLKAELAAANMIERVKDREKEEEKEGVKEGERGFGKMIGKGKGKGGATRLSDLTSAEEGAEEEQGNESETQPLLKHN